MSKYIVGQNSIMDSSNSSSPRMFTEGQEIPEDIIETYKKSDVLDILLKDGRIKEVKEDKEENQEENKEQNQEISKEESQQAEQKSAKQTKTKK